MFPTPNLEPVTAQQDEIRIRHIGPEAAVWPGAPVDLQQYVLLNQTSMIARTLPVSTVPGNTDFVSGSWTLRLDDAGELQIVWPNTTSSDGPSWRSRFNTEGHLEFLEVYFNGELDSVGVIDQVTPDEQSVTVHADDGWWMLKKAYVRDWTVTQAPRDVIERGTCLWVPATTDSFPASSEITAGAIVTPNGSWSLALEGSASAGIGASGGLELAVTASDNDIAYFSSESVQTSATVWACQMQFGSLHLAAGNFVNLVVLENGAQVASVALDNGFGYATIYGTQLTVVTIPAAPTYTLLLESDGEWLWGFINGQLIGCGRRTTVPVTQLGMTSQLQANASTDSDAAAGSVVVTGVLLNTLAPFLMGGSDKGDYVLPGDATSYPYGGLSARYFNDSDLAGNSEYLSVVLSPSRTQAYGAASPAEYADQQDQTINSQAPPTALAANWSCVWFGSIYLQLSDGDYSFEISLAAGGYYAVRMWVGQTMFGAQILDEWAWATETIYACTVSAETLAGTLPNGEGSVVRDGWYPIKVEFAVGDLIGTSDGLAPALVFAPPVGYTDPGGTVLAAQTQILVPATSLSPLGMMDQRYQGIAHYDLVQQTLQAAGLHATVEPKQLESGLFPGVLAPRIREGHDTDIVLRPDQSPRADGEGLLNYSVTYDSTDFGSSIQGNGASLQNGATGQLQSMVYDPSTMLASLFDAQIWQDNSDASLPALLQALLNSQLALSLEPWQSLSADPTGRPRRAFTWPLPGTIQAMRWRPGDGLFIQAPVISVQDTQPRQILVFTRNIGPSGSQSSAATFANRPKNQARTMRQIVYALTRLQRNYQRPAG